MTKTIVFASVCCVASFLLGSAAHINGHADAQEAVAATPHRPFIGRYQMITSERGPIRILDTATGKYVQQEQITFNHPKEWVEIDPIGKKITSERFEEMIEQARKAVEEGRRLRALENPDAQ